MPNQLFYGDNLEVLRRHIRDETVDLCYIDPPFNSKRNYNQIYLNQGKEDQAQAQAFIDTWIWDDQANQGLQEIQANEQGRFTAQLIALISGLVQVLGRGSLLAYLISMSLRVVEIHRVLKPTGSFYLHCDPTASHYLKIVLDAVFCAHGGDFKNEIVWKRTTAHNDATQGLKRFGKNHDVIFFYTKTSSFIWNNTFINYDEDYIRKNYGNFEEQTGRYYKTSDLTAAKPGGDTSYKWKGMFPSKGRYWAYSKANMERFDLEGRIVYTRNGMPRLKHYLDEMPGISSQDTWIDVPPISAKAKERLGYPTQKPEALLERIIKASSNEGDVVLDAYCGCGTTVAVAQKLNRQWIGIDITYQSISLILKRLEDTFGRGVLDTINIAGIPKDMASATALANKKDDRTRKEFEKWAVLTYSNNRAVIQQRKGKDQGIDGIAYFSADADQQGKVIFQVKSGNVKSGDIRDLRGTMEREGAAIGIFITLKPPTKDMIQEAKSAGIYQSIYMNQPVDKIQIVTVQEIIEAQKRFNITMILEVLKSAEQVTEIGTQKELDLE